MTADDRKQWIALNGWRATNAITILYAAKKQKGSDYDSRIRLLKEFVESAQVVERDSQQFELFEPNSVLSPSIARLIETPLRGLQ